MGILIIFHKLTPLFSALSICPSTSTPKWTLVLTFKSSLTLTLILIKFHLLLVMINLMMCCIFTISRITSCPTRVWRIVFCHKIKMFLKILQIVLMNLRIPFQLLITCKFYCLSWFFLKLSKRTNLFMYEFIFLCFVESVEE